ncbi:MAG: methyl-accepting chemotaxis protein [Sulfitobacter sp.]
MDHNIENPTEEQQFSFAKIGVKLPSLMGLMVIATIVILLVANSFLTEKIIERAVTNKLENVTALKVDATENLLMNIERDIRLMASNPTVITALIALADGFSSLENPMETLQRVYIEENPHPLGQKDLLVSADTGSSYGFIHNIYHPTLDQLQNEMDYYDVFLFDTDGNLVYSVFKELDYATNMNTGPWRDSGLADSFHAAMENGPTDETTFVDFAPYAPSNFAPAAFLSRPIFNSEGTRIGVLAYQMPIGNLNTAIREIESSDKTIDGFLVGPDGLLRTDSLATAEDDILATQFSGEFIDEGIAGGSGLAEYRSRSGEDMVAYFEPIEFLGTKWVAVMQDTRSHLYSGLPWALKIASAIAAVTLGAMVGVAVILSRNISTPIQRLTKSVRKVADGDYAEAIPDTDRKDELGDLAQAAEIFRGNLMKIADLNKEQEAASKRMSELAAEQEEAARREAVISEEKEAADSKSREDRETMMRDLGDSFGTVVEAAINGEFSKRVEARFDDQILNELAGNINQLLSAVDAGLNSTGQAISMVADGDLTKPMVGDFRGAFGHLKDNTNNMIDGLQSLIGEITHSGGTLVNSSAELRDTAGALSKRAEQNASSLEETSAAVEELSASITQVSNNVSDASENAKLARETAESSGKVAAAAAESMTNITEGSKEIARVVAVINDIAFQINLLALNAGVEAARAGEAGRGFSVVASEVRQLAQRASEAAKEVDAVITRSDKAVSDGVKNVSAAQSSLSTIADSVVSISSGIEGISSAVREQVSVIGEINSAIGLIDQNTQKQAAAFEEVTAASAVLASEANSLGQSTSRFQTDDKGSGDLGQLRQSA